MTYVPYDTQLDAIERIYKVNIDVADVSGMTTVYRYTADNERIAFEFYSMNPDIEDVQLAAQAIDVICTLCDKRPRVCQVLDAR